MALANDQLDLAWMGPWGYALANAEAGAETIATVKYDGKPIYQAIVVGRPGLNIKTWPDDAKGLKMSFADVGSTSGWLIPTTIISSGRSRNVGIRRKGWSSAWQTWRRS